MEKKIKVHSFIDVITNSSTESYVRSNAKSVKFMHDFINEILKESGSEKKSEDLFEFTIVPTDEALENVINSVADDIQESGVSYKDTLELVKRKVESGEINLKDYLREADLYDNVLLMKSKNNDQFTIDVSDRFSDLFDFGERSS